jgi:hypothetical protein
MFPSLAALLLVPGVLLAEPCLDGTWQIVSIYRDGELERNPGDTTLVIQGGRFPFLQNGKAEDWQGVRCVLRILRHQRRLVWQHTK